MPTNPSTSFEVIVVGGGHAGVEAAWAAANLGARTALVTLDPSKIGVMSCNPAIGGLAKGQMVREIDALGGLMPLATDATGIMFKMLNTSKGPAVHGPRAQCDKHAYAREVQRLIRSRELITIIPAAADALIVEGAAPAPRVFRGLILASTVAPEWDGVRILGGAVVITTGTFMRGLMHTGESMTPGGRHGEPPSTGLSASLRELGFELGRLKTGTPPRLRRSSIDWDALEEQVGDDPPIPFSDLTDTTRFPAIEQVSCHITRTTPEAHEAIRANLHRAPMFSGQIESAGPRYCPSIEDKVVRFADRDSHHVFLEPESHESDWVYCNGIATSLPKDVQEMLVRSMPGCERCEILMHGYAVEYDMVRPHQIHPTGMSKLIDGLLLAGQINGTSGYEEAAAQGLIAGINAVRHARAQDPIAFARDEGYLGVMMDDLVTKTPREPYRMFTSRAEHRLLLRADNAADRLTPIARRLGLIDDQRWATFERRRAAIEALDTLIDATRIDARPLAQVLKRSNYSVQDLTRDLIAANPGGTPGFLRELPRGVIESVLAERQYEGYIARQRAEVRRMSEWERRPIPAELPIADLHALRAECRQALDRFRPGTIGQASRLEGVTPSDITLLLVAIERHRRRLEPA
ncbi:MAG: tRNA uridine-5-carboxymethylaminomethyl(34) synthesis enzyme MnmG [Phycisphaerales bacterium]